MKFTVDAIIKNYNIFIFIFNNLPLCYCCLCDNLL